MTTSTPNLALVLYNSTTDSAEYFSNFRAVIAGTSLTSNFYKIDTAYGNMQTEIDTIQAGAYFTLASFISANYYEATVTGITSYTTGMKIILSLDTASAGTVTLNINSLGTKSVMKIDSTGTPVNISAGELMVGKYYFFAYDGTRWVWVDATSADQTYIGGTVGNLVKISSNNTLEDAGVLTTLPENISFTGDITPSQITSNQNNYAPTGLSTASTIRLSTDASRDITGLSGGSDGRILILANVGSFDIVLISQSASSSAANRFILDSDTTIKSNQDVIIQYDSTSSRWRLIGGTSLSKASSSDVATGTDDAKFVTALAIKNSHNVPSVAPSTSGNIMTSNGTDWVSSVPIPAKGRVEILAATVPTTLGAPIGQINGGSSPVEGFPYFSFVDGTITYRDFYCRLIGYNGGGLTVNFEVLRTSAASGLRYVFEAAIRRIATASEDITTSQTYDYNAVTVTIPAGTPAAGIPMAGTITFTNGADMDSLADGESFVLRFRRNATSATDDATDTARVLATISVKES